MGPRDCPISIEKTPTRDARGPNHNLAKFESKFCNYLYTLAAWSSALTFVV
jgi:hypothetical protein